MRVKWKTKKYDLELDESKMYGLFGINGPYGPYGPNDLNGPLGW